MFYTYVLKDKDGDWYTGWSSNLISRLKEHQSGFVLSTKHKRPVKLVYYEACLNKDNAIKREKSLKTGFGRAYLRRRISYPPK